MEPRACCARFWEGAQPTDLHHERCPLREPEPIYQLLSDLADGISWLMDLTLRAGQRIAPVTVLLRAWAEARMLLGRAISSEERNELVLSFVRRHAPVRVQDIVDNFSVKRETAQRILRNLVQLGFLTREREGGKAIWRTTGSTITVDEADFLGEDEEEEAQ